MYAINRDKVIDAFRDAVLAALDEKAKEIFRVHVDGMPGASDADLPELFRTLDAHVEKIAMRYDAVLVDYETPKAFAA